MNAKRVIVDGLAKIEVNGKILEPCAFMTYRPDARIFADFQRAGIPFASFVLRNLKRFVPDTV